MNGKVGVAFGLQWLLLKGLEHLLKLMKQQTQQQQKVTGEGQGGENMNNISEQTYLLTL